MAKYCDCSKVFDSEYFKSNAYVKFREFPVRLASKLRISQDSNYTIKNLVFRVNQLGNIVTAVELNQLPGEYVSPSVLELVKINPEGALEEPESIIQKLIAENNELRTRNNYLESLVRNSL